MSKKKTVIDRKKSIRTNGVEFTLSPATRFQHDLIEADVVKMVEENMDILIEAVDSRKDSIDVGNLFSKK